MNQFPQQVFDFNSDIVKSTRADKPSVLDGHRTEHNRNSLMEEAEEFFEASMNGDVVGAVDAVIDSMYFGLGILYKMGLTVEQIENCMSAVHGSNMTKRRGEKTRGTTTSGEDAIKPDGWVPPEQKIKEILGL